MMIAIQNSRFPGTTILSVGKAELMYGKYRRFPEKQEEKDQPACLAA
jgi:hypothetical protein